MHVGEDCGNSLYPESIYTCLYCGIWVSCYMHLVGVFLPFTIFDPYLKSVVWPQFLPPLDLPSAGLTLTERCRDLANRDVEGNVPFNPAHIVFIFEADHSLDKDVEGVLKEQISSDNIFVLVLVSGAFYSSNPRETEKVGGKNETPKNLVVWFMSVVHFHVFRIHAWCILLAQKCQTSTFLLVDISACQSGSLVPRVTLSFRCAYRLYLMHESASSLQCFWQVQLACFSTNVLHCF